jgi:hypothetical protein
VVGLWSAAVLAVVRRVQGSDLPLLRELRIAAAKSKKRKAYFRETEIHRIRVIQIGHAFHTTQMTNKKF